MFKLLLVLILSKSCLTSFHEFIDLSWEIDNKTIYWSDSRSFTFTSQVADDSSGYWYAQNDFCSGEHGGTHLDSPYHFNENGWKVSEIPLNRLIAKGATIDLSHTNSTQLTTKDLDNWVRRNGNFEHNTVLLIKFGMSKYWPNRTKYMMIGPNGTLNFPGVSPEAAAWIADSGRIVGVGLDTPSVDPGVSTEFMAHRILCKNLIYIIENVKLLVDLPVRGYGLLVFPMKIRGGTGAPLRLVAVINKWNTWNIFYGGYN